MKLRTVLFLLAAVTLVTGPSFAGFAGTDVFVPLVGYSSASPPRGNEAPATLWLANRSTTANALIIVELYTAGAPDNPVARTRVLLGPSESTSVEDPLHALFGMSSVDGSLRLTSSTEILAAIHTGCGSSTATAGAGFEGVPASFAIAVDESSTLLGVVETTDEGYRFSVVETSGQPATAQLTLVSDSGTMIAGRSYNLPAHGQVEGSVADLSPLEIDLPSGRLQVQVTKGAGTVLAYGVRTTQTEANDAGFAMSFSDNILVSPYTDVTSLNQLTGDLVLQAGDNVSVTTTPNGGGQPGGTITLDTPAYTAGTGLSLAGTQFNVNFGGSGSANTAARSDHKHVGEGWLAGDSRVLWLENNSRFSTLWVQNDSNSTWATGVRVLTLGDESVGVKALHQGTGGGTGVAGGTNSASYYAAGVRGTAYADGHARGVWGEATGDNTVGIYGQASGESSWAGYFVGDVNVTGGLYNSASSFKIDDPIDPANKYLYHSFVESPDMMNIYNGNVVTDAKGVAEVVLPDWFEALNRDFRYQLTVIGQFAQAIVAKKIEGNRFTIRTNKPNVEVSWQVTGIRHDPYANAHRIPVEQEKPAGERGYYLYPELYGYGRDRAVDPVVRDAKTPTLETATAPPPTR